MKRIAAVMLLALVAFPASAQEMLRPIKSIAMPFDSTGRAVTDPNGFMGGYNIGPFTQILRLVCTQSCFVAFSATDITPTISLTSTTAMFIPANVPQLLQARGNQRIAVIRLSADGTLYITEMSK